MNQNEILKTTPRVYKGKWAGLPATYWAEVLGISPTMSRKLLRKKQLSQSAPLTPFDIGEMICEYKNRKQNKSLDKYISRWTTGSM